MLMKRLTWIPFTIILLAACQSSYDTHGYFKDGSMRVYNVVAHDTTQAGMDDYAGSLMQTAGQPTTVFFYLPGNQIDVSAAVTYAAAYERANAANWHYKWHRNPNGEVVKTLRGYN